MKLLLVRLVSFFVSSSALRVWCPIASSFIAPHRATPSWLQREHEVVIEQMPEIYHGLFDEDSTTSCPSSLQFQSLRQISQVYCFTLSFLGEYCANLGCPCPVDLDKPIGDFMTGEQVHSLMSALHSLDPFECNIQFSSLSVDEIAREHNVSPKVVTDICDKERVPLPFGRRTILKDSTVNKVKEILRFVLN